jgi:hypothetical protein
LQVQFGAEAMSFFMIDEFYKQSLNKEKQMKIALMFLVFLLATSGASATTSLTIECSVQTGGERTGKIDVERISFDADTRYEKLKLSVYGSNITASALLSSSGNLCEHKSVLICMSSKNAEMCTDDQVTIYPTAKMSQVGDRTYISCEVLGQVSIPCNQTMEN